MPNNRVNFVFNSASARSKLLSAAECESVIGLAEADASRWHAEFKTHGPDHETFKKYDLFVVDRNSKDPAIGWLPQRFKEKIAFLNSEIWKFDLDDITDIFVLRYGVGDKLGQHWDMGEGGWDRKLAMLVQLSAADAYDGGVLEYGFLPSAVASREQGALLVFPSWVPHQVTPITSGTRYIAGCFVLGPSFR